MSVSSRFFDRTLSNIRIVWSGIASLRKDSDALKFGEDLPETEHSLLLEKIEECLKGKGGEVSARSRAAALGEMYLGLSLSHPADAIQRPATGGEVPCRYAYRFTALQTWRSGIGNDGRSSARAPVDMV